MRLPSHRAVFPSVGVGMNLIVCRMTSQAVRFQYQSQSIFRFPAFTTFA